MIFLDKTKNLRIYKTQAYLPTVEDDKKKFSTIMLLTPTFESSKRIMESNLFVNKLRYASYYLERELSYFINDKSIKSADYDEGVNENFNYQALEEMSAAERNKLPDSAFGIPSKRKYPLDTEAHVRSAIKFFNYCDKEDEAELARNIIKAMKKFNITDVKVGEKNRFSKYYTNPTNESASSIPKAHICYSQLEYFYQCWKNGTMPENIARQKIFQIRANYMANSPEDTPATMPTPEEYYKSKGTLVSEDYSTKLFMEDLKSINHTNLGDLVLLEDDTELLEEDAKYDARLKKLLFKDRLKKRADLVELYDHVKASIPFIKYAFPDLARYQSKNLFIDLYFYNNLFFRNNDWVQKRAFDLYYDFLGRLINKTKYKSQGYKYNTIFIPVPDWDMQKNGTVWNYKISVNPISIIYHLLYSNSLAKLTKLFGDTNIIFVGNTTYFRLNFKEIKEKEVKSTATKFKNFVIRICTTEEFDAEDVDTSADNKDAPEIITAKIVDTIDINKGIDITPQIAKVKSSSNNKNPKVKASMAYLDADTDKNIKAPEIDVANIDKLTLSDPNTKAQVKANKAERSKLKLAAKVYKATAMASDEDEAYENLEYEEGEEGTESITALLQDIQTNTDDSINISVARAERMSELDDKLMDTEVKGKTVKDILNTPEPEPETTELNIASPNEEWKSMTFTNFDKNYNVDKDIIAAFRHLSTVSRPLSIKEISVENTSTSEDRIETYTVGLEDYRGKRYTVKLDIPLMADNRFLLRGNSKSIQMQLFNMPILKTERNTCQIISNYMKIFVYRVGESQGRQYPLSNKFIKAANKYTGKDIKFVFGDCSRVSERYQLPIDYIGISSYISKIETSEYIFYFNQDEIRQLYTVDESLGIPYAYNKRSKDIEYLSYSDDKPFINTLLDMMDNHKEFIEVYDNASAPTKSAFSRCSIMSSDIPMIIICGYHEGLRKTLDKAGIEYQIVEKITNYIRSNRYLDWIKFSDGYLVYKLTYSSSLLLNGLKPSPTEDFSIGEIDNKNMYLEFLDDYGGRIKADGLENFYDLMIDPITKEVLEYYKLPTDYVSMLLYANSLLADNKFIKHTDMSSRRMRRYELIAVYTYKALAEAYAEYARQLKHSRAAAEFYVKQSAVIDKFLLDSITSDDSCLNALRDIETTNAVTTKGPSGMNADRAYSLDKRTYDPSMENVLGMSTGFAANVGVTRQATINSNIEGSRGYVKSIDGDTNKMNTASTLTATEGVCPMGSTHDDPIRTAMNFIQTSKHMVRTVEADPLLVTSGMDEAMPYLSSDQFAFKAKKDGTIAEITEDYIIIDYNDGTHDYIKLESTIQKNSDGGYYVPLKLDPIEGLKVGQKIKTNQIVAYDKLSYTNNLGESNNLAYTIGKLAKVAVINTDDGFEDSGVITKALSDKLATHIDLQYDKILEKDTTVLSIAKVGDHVEVGDPLLVWNDVYEDENANALLKNLTQDDVSELGKRKLTSEVTGIVKGIKIFRTIELDELSDSLKKIVSAYEKKYVALEKKLTSLGLDKSNVPSHYKLPATGKLKKAQDAVLIEFYVEYEDTVGVGDKIVYDRANKSVIKSQIPEGEEPYTAFRPNEKVDAFVSEVSIDKRMVTSTIIVGAMNKLLVELDRSVKDILGIEYDDSKI